MRLSVIPPEYFPRQQVAALALHVDRLVLADTSPFQRRSFQNRTKIRTPQGWHWARIPTFGKQSGKAISEVEIEQRERWAVKHWRSLQFNYRSTPYFEFYEPRFDGFFDRDWSYLAEITCESMERMLGLLDLDGVLVRASSLDRSPSAIKDIIDSMRGDVEGLVLPAGWDGDAPDISEVRRLCYKEPKYEQNFDGFEEGMTALDLIFNYGPDAAAMLKEASSLEPLQ